MWIFLFIYTLFMLAGSAFTLGLVPRALKDLGRERQRLRQDLPEANFEMMVEAGYRVNSLLVLFEVLYYYLLLSYSRGMWQLFWGGFVFGVIHIGYLIGGRLEKRRLSRGITRTGAARIRIWLMTILTVVEIGFLVWVCVLLLQPAS